MLKTSDWTLLGNSHCPVYLIKKDAIVVIGTAARDGIKAAVIGNTAERILDALNTNILTVNVG